MGNTKLTIGALITETPEPRFRGLAMGFGPGFLLAGAFNLLFVSFFAWSMLGYSQGKQKTSEQGLSLSILQTRNDKFMKKWLYDIHK